MVVDVLRDNGDSGNESGAGARPVPSVQNGGCADCGFL